MPEQDDQQNPAPKAFQQEVADSTEPKAPDHTSAAGRPDGSADTDDSGGTHGRASDAEDDGHS